MVRYTVPALALLTAALSIPVMLTGAGRSTTKTAPPAINPAKAVADAKLQAASHLAGLPIYFEPNRGQTDPSVSYLANLGGTRLFLTRDTAVFSIQKPRAVRNSRSADTPLPGLLRFATEPSQPPTVVRMRTVNSLRGTDEAIEKLPGISNYLIGRDSAKWVTNVPQFGKVKRRGVYPGIDMVFYGNQRQLEYDFVLAPGADPNRIELAYDGVDSIHTNPAGDLVLATSAGDFIQKKPKVYQNFNGKRTEVGANYRIGAGRSIRFEVARYDRAQPLIIDPVIVFNAIAGSSGDDQMFGMAIDSSLNIYVTGTVVVPDFPLVNAFQSTFSGSKIYVFKLNSTGTALLYSTYLGGERVEGGLAIAVDSSGNAIVAGSTTSTSYPVVAAAQGAYGGGINSGDGVVSKLNASGSSLLYSTYLGGSGDDQPEAIAVDSSGSAYVVGLSTGNFPFSASGVFQNGFAGGGSDCTVTKYSSAGVIAYSSYLGGSDLDLCNSVAVDSSGRAYVTGLTLSSDFPRSPGAAQQTYGGKGDGFVTRIAANGGTLDYSTLIGGEGYDFGRAIAVDSQGAAYVAGPTQSAQMPISAGVFQPKNQGLQNGFVAKVSPSGGSFVYVTYLGGRKSDSADGIAVDSSGNAYVVGGALSDDFPIGNAVLAAKPGVGGVIMKSTNATVSFSSSDAKIPSFLANGILINSASGLLITPANGTVYKSDDSGASWTNVKLPTVAGLAQGSSSSLVVYSYPSNGGNPISKSTNGGASWTTTTPSQSACDGSPCLFMTANVAVSAVDPNRLLAASSSGMWQSTDGGQNWSRSGNQAWSWVTFLGDNASAVACAPTGAGVYRTGSGPGSFQLSNGGISASSGCTRVTTDPNNAGIVYVTASDGLYKSVNGGQTWSLLSNLQVAYPVVAIAPGNSSILVAGGRGGGIYRSLDGGASWTASSALTGTPVQGLAIAPTDSNTVYAAIDIEGEAAGFLTVVNSAGTGFNSSTFLGGPNGTQAQGARAVAVDSSGNAYVAGQTASPFFRATSGALNAGYGGWDVFVTKIAPSAGSCILTFGPSTLNPYGVGGSFPIEVFAPSGCLWTANPGAFWVSLAGAGSGTGSASTTVVVAGNSGAARSTTIGFTTGQSITINQAAGGCSYGFSPNTGSVSSSGGSSSANLSTSTGCAWNALSSEPWLTLSNSSGSGGASISFTATGNPSTTARTALITVSSASFMVTQSGAAGNSYTGSVDNATCSVINGWVADLNRLNTSIVVSLWDGATQIASATANGARGDVGAAIGDNGLHGFSLQLPSAYQNGVAHTLQVRYETSTTQVPGSPISLTCGQSNGANYAGYVDGSSCSGINGWAADRNRLGTSIVVSLWDGSTQIASTTANGSRSDVGGLLGDNGLHGFSLQIPAAYQNGVAHTLQIHYETTSTQLPGSPVTLTCSGGGTTNYAGYIDSSSCAGINGWAADKNRLGTVILVSLWDGSTQIASVTANGSRSDVGGLLGDNGLHGFSLQIPSAYQNGVAHTLQVRFETSGTQLTGSPVTLTCGGSTGTNYAGYIDSASCSGINGWAADKNRLNTSIVVSLWDGSTQIASVTANGSRSDVGALLGDNGLHAFSLQIPAGYQNGVAHTLQIRYESSATQLPVSPVTLTCGGGGTTNYAGYIDSSTCSGINGWAADKNRLNTSIVVSLYDGAAQIASVTANGSRSDVGGLLGDNGLHGFSLQLPAAYQNGTAHTLQVRFETSTSQVFGSPVTLTCGSSATNFAGYVDALGCTVISGWAADKNQLNTSINVQLFDGATLLGNTLANISRGDVGSVLGDNGQHGFTFSTPNSLKGGGSHTVTIRPTGSTFVIAGPQSLSCP